MSGLTVTEVPDKLPGCHVKVKAPPAVKVAVLPWQIIVGEADAVIVGAGKTVTVTPAIIVQVPLAPITV